MVDDVRANIAMALAASSSANPRFPYSSNNYYKNQLEIGGLFSTRRNQLLHNNEIAAAARIQMPRVMELAISAMQEVDAMARIGEPLWVNPAAGRNGRDRSVMVLNHQEYVRVFQRNSGPTQHEVSRFRCESSRATAVLIMNPLHIVQIFMEMVKFFSSFFLIKLIYAYIHTYIYIDEILMCSNFVYLFIYFVYFRTNGWVYFRQ